MALSINMAFIEKKDWERFLEIIDDRATQYDKWEKWHEAYLKGKTKLIKEGFNVNDFHVDLDELINYCKKQQIKIDGKARSKFVAKGGFL